VQHLGSIEHIVAEADGHALGDGRDRLLVPDCQLSTVPASTQCFWKVLDRTFQFLGSDHQNIPTANRAHLSDPAFNGRLEVSVVSDGTFRRNEAATAVGHRGYEVVGRVIGLEVQTSGVHVARKVESRDWLFTEGMYGEIGRRNHTEDTSYGVGLACSTQVSVLRTRVG
jgi:hypothetical protein